MREGVKKTPFGTTRSPLDRNVKIKRNGIGIATNKGELVRAVFEGVVYQIMTPKNGNNVVMVKHGNYFTIYKNLSKIYVKKGDKVTTRQNIGEVNVSHSGESILSFQVWKGTTAQNPSYWIKQ